jgi:hypothetical protein
MSVAAQLRLQNTIGHSLLHYSMFCTYIQVIGCHNVVNSCQAKHTQSTLSSFVGHCHWLATSRLAFTLAGCRQVGWPQWGLHTLPATTVIAIITYWYFQY